MAEQTIVELSSLFGGISRQPDHLRLANQVADGENVEFKVEKGWQKRNGSKQWKSLGTLTEAGNYRLHSIIRDSIEQYQVVYGLNVLRVIRISDGVEATVNIDTDAADYLASAASTTMLLVSAADYTFIANKLIPLATATSPNYAITAAHRDFDVMVSVNPAYNTYHKASGRTSEHPAGYFKFTLEENGFASWFTNNVTANWDEPADYWNEADKNPMGFKVRFQRQAFAASNLTWTAATKRLALAGFFADYTFEAGDEIYIASGTGVTPGYYAIAAKITDDTIELTTSIGSNSSNVVASGVSKIYEVEENFYSTPAADMDEVAQRIQKALRDKGATDALVSWAPASGGNFGKFTIVSPYRGTGAKVLGTSAPSSGYDISQATTPFVWAAGNVTDGSGSPTTATYPVLDRWEAVPAPDQREAIFDPATMPVVMVRESTVPLVFSVKRNEWGFRKSGDEYTNPVPSPWKKNRTISDMMFHENRLWFACDDVAVGSQANSFYDFYIEDATNIVDSDPIERTMPGNSVSVIDYMTPFQKSLSIFARNGKQFELSGAADILSPAKTVVQETTNEFAMSVRPKVMGGRMYFLASMNNKSALMEYFYDDNRVGFDANNVAVHVPGFMGSDIRSITTHSQTGTVFVLPNKSRTSNQVYEIYVYRSYWQGSEKRQSAWSVWKFSRDYRILDINIVGTDMYILSETGIPNIPGAGIFTIDRLPLAVPVPDSGMTIVPTIDRMFSAIGTYDAGNNRTVFTKPQLDYEVNCVVLGPLFGASTGSAMPVLSNTTTEVRVTGNISGKACYLGRYYDAQVELSRPYVRDQNGIVRQPDAWMNVRRVTAIHEDSGAYEIQAIHSQSGTRVKRFAPTSPESGELVAWAQGKTDSLRVVLKSRSHQPWTVSRIQILADVVPTGGR